MGTAEVAAVPSDALHVAPEGSDQNPGTTARPLATIAGALRRARKGGTIVLQDGVSLVSRPVELTLPGLTLRALHPGKAAIRHGRFTGPIFDIHAEGTTLEGLHLDGGFVDGAGAVRGRLSAGKLALRNCEVRDFTRHAVDIDGPDSVVEDCHIHHILWMNHGERDDAHGIVTSAAQRLRVRNCDIHHVSGDCFQAGRSTWQDITIEECKLWDGPLEERVAGFEAGDRCAENAIDTKIDARAERGRLLIRKCSIFGFRSIFIDNAAALNLKENADVVVDGCTIANCEIAFRLRGTVRGAQLWPCIMNCLIQGCDVAVRHEDNLVNLRFVHNTVGNCREMFHRAPPTTKIGHGWIVANNIFTDLEDFPKEVPDRSNYSVEVSRFHRLINRRGNLADLQAKPIEGATPAWYSDGLKTDLLGQKRSEKTPTAGAFEPRESDEQ